MWKCSDANGCGTGVSPFWFCVALPGLAAGSARIQGTNLPVGARPWLLTAAPAGADVRLRRSLRLIPGTIPATVGRSRCLEAVVAHVRSRLPGVTCAQRRRGALAEHPYAFRADRIVMPICNNACARGRRSASGTYFFSKSRMAADIAVTPVAIVGSGVGKYSDECSDGSALTALANSSILCGEIEPNRNMKI